MAGKSHIDRWRNPEKRDTVRPIPAAVKVALVAFVAVFGLFLIGVGAYDAWVKAVVQPRMKPVDAVVVRSSAVNEHLSLLGSYSRFSIKFTYQVNGVEYTSDRAFPGLNLWLDRHGCETLHEDHLQGTMFKASYDPLNPSFATALPDVNACYLVVMLAGLWLILLQVIWMVTRRRIRLRELERLSMVPHTNIILPGYDTGKLDMLVIGSSMIVMGGVVLLLDPRVIGVSQLLFSLVSGSGLLIVIFTKIAIISQGNSCKYWAIIKKAPVAPGDHLQLAVRTCNGELREKKLLAVVQVRRIASKGRASVMGLKVLDFTFADQDGEEYLKLEWQIPEDLQRPTAGMKSDIPEFQIEVRALTFTLRYEIPFVEVAGQPSADPAFSLPPLSAQPV